MPLQIVRSCKFDTAFADAQHVIYTVKGTFIMFMTSNYHAHLLCYQTTCHQSNSYSPYCPLLLLLLLLPLPPPPPPPPPPRGGGRGGGGGGWEGAQRW